jgi:hypothetical protein
MGILKDSLKNKNEIKRYFIDASKNPNDYKFDILSL